MELCNLPVDEKDLFDAGNDLTDLSYVGGEVRNKVPKCSVVRTDHYLNNETAQKTCQAPVVKGVLSKCIIKKTLSFEKN